MRGFVSTIDIRPQFILGTVIADTIGTFETGHDGRTSLTVGMGMPQIGEFSLDMVKVGTERAAIGGFLYPVIALTPALTSLVYPYIFRSADATANFLERRSPQLLRLYVAALSEWFASLRSAFALRSDRAIRIQHSSRIMMLNPAIVVVLLAIGTFVLQFTPELADLIGVTESLLGLGVGFGLLVLCTPAGIAIWRELQRVTDELSLLPLRRHATSSRIWNREELRSILRDSTLASIMILLATWAIPFVSELLRIGDLSLPVPFLILLGIVFVTASSSYKVYKILESAFRKTFLGPDENDDQN